MGDESGGNGGAAIARWSNLGMDALPPFQGCLQHGIGQHLAASEAPFCTMLSNVIQGENRSKGSVFHPVRGAKADRALIIKGSG